MDEVNSKGIEENPIVKKSFLFALEIIQYADTLETDRRYVISNQLLKSGTSVGANIWESQHAESRADFIHKLKIAAKEAKETEYWLLLCKYSTGYLSISDKLEKLLEIQKMLPKIISSTRKD